MTKEETINHYDKAMEDLAIVDWSKILGSNHQHSRKLS